MHVRSVCLLHIPVVNGKLLSKCGHICRAWEFLRRFLRRVQAELFPATVVRERWAFYLLQNKCYTQHDCLST